MRRNNEILENFFHNVPYFLGLTGAFFVALSLCDACEKEIEVLKNSTNIVSFYNRYNYLHLSNKCATTIEDIKYISMLLIITTLISIPLTMLLLYCLFFKLAPDQPEERPIVAPTP